MAEKQPIPGWLKVGTILCAVAFVVPVVVFVATHNMYPGNNPGGFGEGYQNMHDALLYGLIIVPAFFGLLIGTASWLVAVARGRK